MERLTSKDDQGVYQVKSQNLDYHSTVTDKNGNTIFRGQHIDKLAGYEDAEENGTLHWFPCKVGDIVYRINKGAKNPVIAIKVTEITMKALRNGDTIMKIICEDINSGCRTYYQSDIGTKLFLTEEEAKHALKKIK